MPPNENNVAEQDPVTDPTFPLTQWALGDTADVTGTLTCLDGEGVVLGQATTARQLTVLAP